VEVLGNHHAPTPQIVAAAGLIPGIRLSAVSASRVATRVEALPWVATATVTHVLPSRIRIAVQERRAAVIVQAGDHAYLVDPEGVVLQQQVGGYPTVAKLQLATVTPGTHISLPAFQAAVAVLDSLPADLRARLAVIDAPSPGLISLVLSDQTTVMYGTPDDLRNKNDDVTALFSGGRTYTSIDVRASTHPAARPR
jgi:cell division protein FtsQ